MEYSKYILKSIYHVNLIIICEDIYSILEVNHKLLVNFLYDLLNLYAIEWSSFCVPRFFYQLHNEFSTNQSVNLPIICTQMILFGMHTKSKEILEWFIFKQTSD